MYFFSAKKLRVFLCSVIGMFLVFGAISCKSGDPKPSPCENVRPVIADFTVEEIMKIGNDYKYPMENDSINGGGWIRLTADETDADEYKWIVGNEPSFRYGKQLHILFEKVYGQINIKLIVKKQSVRECFPDAAITDTVVKSIWITPLDTTILHGTYIGTIDNRPAKDTVKIYTYNNIRRISGLEQSCSPLQQIVSYTTTYQLYLREASNVCAVYEGYGILEKDTKKLTITYTERDKNANLINRKFVGFKIN